MRANVLAAIAGGLVGLSVFTTAAAAQPAPLVYEGRLSYLDAPVDSRVDMRFRLFDAAQGGAQIGDAIEHPATTLEDGAFRFVLDFGHQATAAWMEVSVRAPAGEGEYVTLSPRQLVQPDPNVLADQAGGAGAGSGASASGAGLALSARTPRDPSLDPAGAGLDPGVVPGAGSGIDRPTDQDVGPAGPTWLIAGANLYYLAGNVGIGTATPINPLQVETSIATQAILGSNSKLNGRGVTGLAIGAGGANFGVFGISFSPGGTGVFGQANHGTGVNFGVTGLSDSTNGSGVRGLSTAASGSPIGVFGQVTSATGWPGFFEGTNAALDQDVGIRDGITVFRTNSANTLIRLRGHSANSNLFGLLELGGVGGSGFVEAPYSLRFVTDNDDTSPDGDFQFWEDSAISGGNELMRIGSGEGAAILGDGAFTSNGIDYAEAFRVAHDGLEPGDVVVMVRGDWEHIARSGAAYDDMLLGVVSERPSFIAGLSFDAEERAAAEIGANLAQRVPAGQSEEEFMTARKAAIRDQLQRTTRPVALAGRVPVKVDASHGPIRAGDRLTSSPTPGHAMVQARPGPSIGIALEDFGAGTGKIMVLVQPGWTGLTDQQYAQLEQRNAELEARLEAIEKLIMEAP